MQSMTELIVRIADLCEAEGRVLRAMTVRLALGVVVILVAAAAVAAGVGLLLVAVYIAIEAQTGAAPAAVATGVLALCIGGVLAWLGRRIGT
jgi:uncharacterized membrane protein